MKPPFWDSKRVLRSATVFGLLLVFLGGPAHATMVIADDPYGLRQRITTSSTTYALDDNGPYFVGTEYFGDGTIQDEKNILIPFDLTGVGTITDASFFSQADHVFNAPYNIDLYGVGYSVDELTLPDTAENLFYVGVSDGTATSIQFDYMVDPITTNAYTASSGASDATLIAYLNARPFGSDVVWFRLNADASVAYVGPTGNELNSVRFDPTGSPPWSGLSDGVPYLDVTAVPEPAASVLLGLGLFGILARLRRCRV